MRLAPIGTICPTFGAPKTENFAVTTEDSPIKSSAPPGRRGGAPVALVTGASTGIGRATAEALVPRGYRVIATCRDPAALAPVDRVDGVDYLALDLGDRESVAACAAAAGPLACWAAARACVTESNVSRSCSA